jgi:hypothetical protein
MGAVQEVKKPAETAGAIEAEMIEERQTRRR